MRIACDAADDAMRVRKWQQRRAPAGQPRHADVVAARRASNNNRPSPPPAPPNVPALASLIVHSVGGARACTASERLSMARYAPERSKETRIER